MSEEKKEVAVKAEPQILPTTNWKNKEGLALVRSIVAKECSELEFKYLYYMADKYNLDPLKKEIWAVKYVGKTALVFVGRDGLRRIAQDSKQLGCIKITYELEKKDPDSKVKYIGSPVKPISATCKIWRKDYDKPYEATCYFDEYDRKMALWKTHPKQMLGKCAEATCLKMAFNITGVFVPEEMPLTNGQKVQEESKDGNETM